MASGLLLERIVHTIRVECHAHMVRLTWGLACVDHCFFVSENGKRFLCVGKYMAIYKNSNDVKFLLFCKNGNRVFEISKSGNRKSPNI